VIPEPGAGAVAAHTDMPGGDAQLVSLYSRWRVPVMRMLRRYFGSPAEIEDAAQEVFVRMAAVGKALAPHEEQPYLRQTLRSVAAQAWHKGPGAHGVQLVAFAECEDEVHAPPLSAAGTADGAWAEHRQRLERLQQAVNELPQRQREAFLLHRVEGHTVQETADRMGISLRMAVKHLARAVAYCETRVQFASAEQMRRLQAAHAVLCEAGDEAADAEPLQGGQP
jgi:RNA polymerase sigma-70 factor (ECF subfamily)